jgi:hypothetical protein
MNGNKIQNSIRYYEEIEPINQTFTSKYRKELES